MENYKEELDWFDEFAMKVDVDEFFDEYKDKKVEIFYDDSEDLMDQVIKNDLLINDVFKDLIPPLSFEELNILEQSILDHGITDPIQTWNGYIIDGHNRYNISKKHNITFQVKELEFNSEEDAKIYIINKQLGRRNINSFVKLELSEKLRDELKKKGKENQGYESKSSFAINGKTEIKDNNQEGLDFIFPKVDSRKEIVKITGTSNGIVSQFDKIKKVIDEPTKEKLRNNETTIGKVYKEIKNKEYKQKEIKLKNTDTIKFDSDDVKLYNCDLIDSEIEDNSIDVIITDPPYPRDYLDCWKKLAEFAVKKLKRGGVLVAMSGQSYLPQVYKNMDIDGLDYYWTGCLYLPGHSPNLRTKRLLTHWKPLLIYVKDGYDRTFQKSDVYISDKENYNETKEGQEFHKWGQSLSLMEKIIQDWTYNTDVVCDPFLGGGTTGVACVNLKRKFIGIELEKEAYDIAKKRIIENGN